MFYSPVSVAGVMRRITTNDELGQHSYGLEYVGRG
jgi:hypothetical protein